MLDGSVIIVRLSDSQYIWLLSYVFHFESKHIHCWYQCLKWFHCSVQYHHHYQTISPWVPLNETYFVASILNRQLSSMLITTATLRYGFAPPAIRVKDTNFRSLILFGSYTLSGKNLYTLDRSFCLIWKTRHLVWLDH